jgi:predicted nucleic acid-binding Zn ribbon protein
MATFAFRCEDCNDEWELKYPVGERPDVLPAGCLCGGDLKHFIAWNGSFRLRGKGWAKHPERDIANVKRGAQDQAAIQASRKEAGLA